MTLDGTHWVSLQSLHGQFAFREQKFRDAHRRATTYLAQTGQARVSPGLEEFCLFYCTRTSYATVVSLVERLCGQPLVCAQTLLHWGERKAKQIDQALGAQVEQAASLPLPVVAQTVDVYAPDAEEVLLFCDAIGVKAQKPTHEKVGQPRKPKPHKRHETDVMLLQKPEGSFAYLMGSTDQKLSVVQVARAQLCQQWQGRQTPLPLVAISDGATKIRQDLLALLGRPVTLLLDWYHLTKRVYINLSLAAHSRAEHALWEQEVLAFLWHGQVKEALAFLSQLSARRPQALSELVGYLEKHAHEIIDYGRRARTGKPIGSGRMEKAVDQVIGMRQKKKGMSWSRPGSHVLALLKVAQLNGQWQQLFAELTPSV